MNDLHDLASGRGEPQLITHSRQDCFKICRKRHWFSYELCIRRTLDGKALRMGHAYHSGLQRLGNGQALDAVVEAVRTIYEQSPEAVAEYDWQIECETVVRLLCGYSWRWQDQPLHFVATERAFQLPLVNPKTGRASRLFQLAGKIDGIVDLGNGRLADVEYKLLGDDISLDATLWRRLRVDSQVSLYMLAARRLGYRVETSLYDLTRKPTIKPTSVPVLDGDGLKIVLDSGNNRVLTAQGKPRQTGDTEKGYVLQVRAMTADEWGDKLTIDIVDRPDYYYVRGEVPRLDSDLEEFEQELWSIQETLRDAQRNNRWYRTVNKNTCDFCSYFDICTSGFNPATDALPEGFVRLENIHPELEGLRNGSHKESTATAAW